jgi:hypothetical protein
MLFLTKSTAKSIQKFVVRKLGAGTLVGGRGLPKDLSSMTVAGGRIMSRPMNGAVEGMLSVLEDPRAETADAAVAGLAERYYNEGSGVLTPHREQLERLLKNRDPGVRRVAAWALGRTGTLDAVPALIEALNDSEADVATAARVSLQILSRKLESPGPSNPTTPEERRAQAEAWKAWYRSTRPLGAAIDAADPTSMDRDGETPEEAAEGRSSAGRAKEGTPR